MDNATYNHVLGPTTAARDYRRCVETVHKTSQKLYIIRESHICIYNMYIYIYILYYLYISSGASGTKKEVKLCPRCSRTLVSPIGFSFPCTSNRFACVQRRRRRRVILSSVSLALSETALCTHIGRRGETNYRSCIYTEQSITYERRVSNRASERAPLQVRIPVSVYAEPGISFLYVQLLVTIRDDLLSQRSCS